MTWIPCDESQKFESLAVDTSRRHFVVSADDVQLFPFRIGDQAWRCLHEMNVCLWPALLPFVRSVDQTSQLTDMNKHSRYYSPARLTNYRWRRKAVEPIKKLSR